LTRPDTSPPPSTTQTNTEPNFALTNEEAITRFEELMTTLEQAYGGHDVTYLDSLYTSDSPLRGIARRELTRLANDGVRDLSTFETKELIVRTNSSSQITLRQVVVVTPRFVTDAGKDVTKSRRPTRQVVDWTVSLQGGNWLLEDALITEAKHIR
jgi:hypothetical protein